MSNSPRPLNELDDQALIDLARTDQAAFGELYQRYVGRIYNYIYYRTSNRHDAEDLTARVFQRAMNHIPTYEDRGIPFSAWLYRIAHNLVVNFHRDRKRRHVIPIDDMVVLAMRGDAPEQVAQQHEERELLMRAIRSLPDDRQQLLILKFVERMSNAEIGVVMGRSEGAIKSLYHRTLISLRDEMSRIHQHSAVEPPRRGVPFQRRRKQA